MSPKTKRTLQGAAGGKGGAIGAVGIATAIEVYVASLIDHPLPPGVGTIIISGLAFVIGAIPSLMRHYGWTREAILVQGYIEDYEGVYQQPQSLRTTPQEAPGGATRGDTGEDGELGESER